MGVSATDIITYIGVPLAVLGVLPILYTFAITILNQRRIRRALVRHGHRPIVSSKQQDGFAIRSSPMTTLIEVELPKFAIAPLERQDNQYWQLSHEPAGERDVDPLLARTDSSLSTIEEGRVRGFLRGGSWRAFNWKKLIVGKKLYRIQYEDELREPPAEVDFTELVHLLLDWGAELDPMGWEKLRSGGLWTPAGTVLLKLSSTNEDNQKGYTDWILRTSMPDEGDGILTLCVKWPNTGDSVESLRGAASLPPGWGRLVQPPIMSTETVLEKADDAAQSSSESKSDLSTRLEELKLLNDDAKASTSMRFKIEAGLIAKVYWEKTNVETSTFTELNHLQTSTLVLSQSWFTAAVASLLLSHPTPTSGALWGFDLPLEISTFARKETMPVGIMVLLEILPNDDAPEWTTLSSSGTDPYARSNLIMQRMHSRIDAEKLEAAMPAAQAAVARSNRMMAELRQQAEDMRQMRIAEEEYENKRFKDAVSSARMDNKTIAKLCIKWLVDHQYVDPTWSLHTIAEAVLYLIVLDTASGGGDGDDVDDKSESHQVLKAIDEWHRSSIVGGMSREQLRWLADHKRSLCFAVCVVAVVQEGALSSLGSGHGKASLNMMECLDMWRKVRLG